MTENFCYNQIGINHILKQFGDAISNKQYKNPIPRDIIRDYIDGEKFINEIPCDSEGRELATLNQNASKANDNW